MKHLTDRINSLTPEQRALLEKRLKAKNASLAVLGQEQSKIPHRGHANPSPLSFDQERLWLFYRIHPESPAFNVYGAARIRGSVNREALVAGINEIVKRHEAWRTVFDRTEPLQIVLPELRLDVPEVDLRGLADEEKESVLTRLQQEEVKRPFDLFEGPLARFKLFHLSDTESRLVFSIHHIVTDNLTVNLFYEELLALYKAYIRGDQTELPEAPIQYADYAEWQRREIQGEKRETLTRFWKEHLQGCEFMLNLPTDFARPPAMSFRGARVYLKTPKAVLNRLSGFAKQESATSFMTLLTAFNILLFRYTGQNDIVVGTPIAGRNRTEMERAFGYFLTIANLRARISGEMTFIELLRQVRETSREALKHQEMPVGLLLDELRIPNDPSRNPLVQAAFLYVAKEKASSEELDFEPLAVDGETVIYDLTLCVAEGEDVTDIFLEYPTDLFRRETIERMAAHWNELLQSMADNPNQPLFELGMLPDEERQRVAVEWNCSESPLSPVSCIHGLFEAQAALYPDRTALKTGGASVTYGEFNRKANRLAHTLQSMGVAPGTTVGIMAERSPELLMAVYAVLKAGGAYVPIDPAFPEERITHIAADAGIKLLLAQASVKSRAASLFAGTIVDLNDECAYAADDSNPAPVAGPDDLAYIIYTSGSTGRPKGVMIEHRSVVNRMTWIQKQYPLGEGDTVLMKAAFTFDLSVGEIFWWGTAGAALCLLPPGDEREPAKIIEAMASNAVTMMNFVPTLLHAFLDHLEGQPRAVMSERLRSLRLVGCIGEPLLPGHVERFYQSAAAEGGTVLINQYGPTEATIDVTHFRCEPGVAYAGVPIGKPIDNTALFVVKEGTSRLQPIGVPGELCIAGVQVARGYRNLPEQTADAFVDCPFPPYARMYRTGDLVRWLPGGNLEYLGRIDQQVKVRGYRIELGEIETRLLALEAVREAAVIVKPDAAGQNQLAAYFAADTELSPAVLKKALASKLPAYMVPAFFVQLDRIPLNWNGKIDRAALPAPDLSAASGYEYAPPRTPEERLLASVWEAVLGLSGVGIHDNFFDQGGDSIISIQLFARLFQAGYKLEMNDLFRHPTIAELASRLQPAGRTADQGEVEGEIAAPPIVSWFLEQENVRKSRFQMSVTLHRASGFEEEAVRAALAKLTAHHDALRLTLQMEGGRPRVHNRSVRDGQLFRLEMYDFRNEEDLSAVVTAAARETAERMQLDKGPLVSAALLRCADGDHLLLAIHHLAVDGASWRVLLSHFTAAYEQALQGEAIRLPVKTEAYRTWAQALSDYAARGEAEPERAYWERIDQAEDALLPKDGAGESGGAPEELTVRLSPHDSAMLQGKALEAYGTEPEDLVLAALGLAASRWGGLARVLLHLESDARDLFTPEVDASLTVGWFTSLYPFLLETGQAVGLTEHIVQVKEARRAVPRRGIGYGLLRYGGVRLTESYTAEGDPETSRPSESERQLQAEPDISFHYVGEAPQAERGREAVQLSALSRYVEPGDVAATKHALFIQAVFREDTLELRLVYKPKAFSRSAMEALAETLQDSLREVISHCAARARPMLTPSDTILPGLATAELARLTALTADLGDLENIYPLTPMQKGMLFHSLMGSGTGTYCEQAAIHIEGYFDPEAFGRSQDVLFQRHEALRTNFMTGYGSEEMLQAVFRKKAGEWWFEDIRQMPADDQEGYIEAYKRSDKEKGFDVSRDSLLRMTILRTGEAAYRLVWSFHHIIMDGWCIALITRDLFETYFALLEQREPVLEPVVPYNGYIRWLQRQDRQLAASYWQDRLAGYERPATVLPDRRAGSERTGYEARTRQFSASRELTAQIERTATKHRVTVNTMIQTVWGLLLQRYNGTEDVVFGSVVSGRPPEIRGVEQIVGLFINTIPVRIRCASDEPFADVMKRAQEHAVSAHAHDTFPLYEIQALTEQKHELINHIVGFGNFPVANQIRQLGTGASSFRITDAEVFEKTNYDFNLLVYPEETLRICFTYNGLAFDEASVERLLGHFMRLLEQAADRPDALVRDLDMLSEAERGTLLGGWNEAAWADPRALALHELLEAQAEQRPNQPAVVFDGEGLTYRELNGRANRLARTLRAQGVQPDQPVGLLTGRSLDMIVGLFAILKAGGAYVPLDPEYPQTRIRYMMEDAGAALLVRQRALADQAAFFAGPQVIIDDEASYAADSGNLEPAAGPEHLAYVIYTSGTTGLPKGTLTTHRNVARTVSGTNYIQIGPEDTLLQLSSYAFDGSAFDIFGALANGAKLVLVSKDDILSPDKLSALIARERITVMFMTTSLFNALVDVSPDSLYPLRKVLFGGERASAAHVRKALRQLGGGKLANVYGPTETTIFATYYNVDALADDALSLPIGRPVGGTALYILGAGDILCPVGVPGELCIAGDGVARGYLNRSEATEARFAADPFVSGQRLYRTGDLARWLPDGNVEYLGRLDDQVKIRGYRIELGEIEAALRQLPHVRETAVTAREAEDGSRLLCAYVVAAEEAEERVSGAALKAALSGRLPAYMVPSMFMRLDSLPLTVNGKVDRNALPAPQAGVVEPGAGHEAPQGTEETALAAVWQSVLGSRYIGAHDNFFELGGDSIKAIQLSSRLLQAGYKLEIKDLFRYPSVRELAPRLMPASVHADQREVRGGVALTPILQWFFGQHQAEPHHFNQAVLLHRPQGFAEPALRRAAEAVALHHDALRLVFRQGENEAYAAWNRAGSEGELFTLATFDFTSEAEPAAAIEREATAIQSSLSLDNGPLMKLALFRCADGDHLLIVIHHLAVDGVSWRILFEDISEAYEQALQDQTVRLPLKTDSFQSWAEALRDYAQSPAMEAERTYWHGVAANGYTPLPGDKAADDRPQTVQDSREVTVAWLAADTERLLRQTSRAYNTEVNDLLLAALGMAVHAWSGGMERLAVNLEGHGREPIGEGIDISRTVGWFTTQFPVVLEIKTGHSVGQRIKAIKELMRAVPNKGIGYGALKYMTGQEAAGALPEALAAEPELSFNYLGQFDQDLAHSGMRFSPYSAGEPVSRQTTVRYPIDISGMVQDGVLKLTLRYNGNKYSSAAAERLAEQLQLSLLEVIDHCAGQAVPELTPSDVLYPGLTMAQLERMTEQTAGTGELENIYPLTPMQQGMLFHSLMEPHTGAYFEQATFELTGPFHPEAFERSLNVLIGRHPILRTNFYRGLAAEPLQAVFRSRAAAFAFEDLRSMDEPTRRAQAAARAEADKAAGFDLARDPLMRVTVLRVDESAYRFIWSFHHMLMDGWCLSLMTGEVFGSYFAFLAGREPELAPVTPYSRYIEWLQRQDTSLAAAHWSDYLAGYEGQTALTRADTAKPQAPYSAASETHVLDADLTARMQQTALRYQVTVNTLMQAAWGIVLQRYNGSGDVVFGSVVSGRPGDIAGVETMIGLFINTVPVRVQSGSDDRFADVLRKVQQQALASQLYETYPLFDIQAATAQKNDLIDHLVVFENYPVTQEVERTGEGSAESFVISDAQMSEQTNYDFSLTVLPGDETRIVFDYNASVFEQAWIRRLQAHFVRVLEQAAAQPEIPVNELELLTADEAGHLLMFSNGPAADAQDAPTLHSLLEAQAARTPGKTAVQLGERRLTYAELDRRAEHLARELQRHGVAPEIKVAIMGERSPELIIGIYAILKAGGAYVPIDPELPEARMRFILEDSGAALLLTSMTQSERLRSLANAGVTVIAIGETAAIGDAQASDRRLAAEAKEAAPNHAAYVIYTSGSTGTPKGVVVEHRQALNYLQSLQRRYALGPDDILLHKTSVSFDASVWELFWWASEGASLCLLPPGGEKDPALLVETISRAQVTFADFAPALLHAFLDYAAEAQSAGRLVSLRRVFVGGEALSAQLAERFRSLLTETNGTRLTNSYGPTETTVECAYYDLPVERTPAAIPIGRPIHGVRLYVVHEGTARLQPVGVWGELCVTGAGVARGYLNRSELTAERFTANPFVPGERMYRTGDLARWLPDGSIEYAGRIDHQVKIRGYRIELGEIEAALRQVENIREAVVTADTGEDGFKRLCAYYVGADALAAGDIRDALTALVPAYMIPAYFMRLEAFPLTAGGKIDRKALPAPEGQFSREGEYAAPRTTVERTLAAVWQAVLHVSTVGIHDNFFELGGDSIRSIQVSSRLLQAGYTVAMGDLFAYPTIAELGPHVAAVGRTAEQGEVTGSAPLTPMQRLYLAAAAQPESCGSEQTSSVRELKPSLPESPAANTQPTPLRAVHQAGGYSFVVLDHPVGFEEAALRLAAGRVIAHHDALRLAFRPTEDGDIEAWYRGAEEDGLFTLDVRDFRAHPDALVAASAHMTAPTVSLSAGGPLVRLTLFLCPQGDRLQVAAHRLVMDTASWRILLEDLTAAYKQALTGGEVRLPDKTDSFRAWSEQLAAYAGSGALAQELAYWQQQTSGETPHLLQDLATDAAESAAWHNAAEVTVVLTEEETVQLLGAAHRAYGTETEDLLLTALGQAVQTWSGQEQVRVSLESDVRRTDAFQLNTGRTIGCFTALHPIELIGRNERPDRPLRQRIKRTKEQRRRVPNQGLGYGLLRLASGDRHVLEEVRPAIRFIYLEPLRLNLALEGAAVEESALQSYGPAIPLQPHEALGVEGRIVNGRLQLALRYSGGQYRRETVEQLAETLCAAVREVLLHGVSRQGTELTPSDVPLQGVSMEALEQFAAQTEAVGELETVYPLSPMQKGMLFHSLMTPGGSVYFEQASFDLEGDFKIEAFAQSLDLLIARHAALRTNFYANWREEPVQAVFRHKTGELHYEDLRPLLPAEREATLAAYTKNDKARGFDLERDGLIRLAILQTGPQSYRFVWSSHHIVMDGWCMSLVTREVFQTYFAITEGREPALGEVIPYSRYIEWLENRNPAEPAAYWSQYLAGYDQQTLLPSGKPQRKGAGYASEHLEYALGDALTSRIRTAAKRHQVTVNTLIQAVWGLLLQRYNGTDDVVFGSVVSGRPEEIPGVEEIIGLFINTIPVRIRSEASMTFAELLAWHQQQAIASHAHDTFPLFDIQALTEQKQDLINHIVVFENYPAEAQIDRLRGEERVPFTMKGVEAVAQTNYDFNLVFFPGDSLGLYIGYNALVFDRAEIERMAAHFLQMLEQVVSKPGVRLGELEVVTAAERMQVLHEFNNPTAEGPAAATIHRLVEQQAERTPDHAAVVCEGQQVTYRELNERANRLARTLQACGVGRGALVGLAAERSASTVVGLLAILKAGGAYVPIDPAYPEERLRYMLHDSGIKLLLAHGPLRGNAAFLNRTVWQEWEGAAAENTAPKIRVISLAEASAYSADSTNPGPVTDAGDAAYVIYTSGTTGQPKGVMVPHRGLANLKAYFEQTLRVTPQDRILQFASLSFDAACWEIYQALFTGAALYIPSQETIQDYRLFEEYAAVHGLTAMLLPPTYAAYLEPESLPALRVLVTGGSALTPELAQTWRHRVSMYNAYGPTENSIATTIWSVSEDPQAETLISIGRPLPNHRVYIVDRHGHLAPVGVPGELCAAGIGLAHGYLDRPALTAEKFETARFSGERIYRTGDLARWLPDGRIEYLGRIDHQVKIRGYRIELGEVETQLLQVDGVQEAVVIAREDAAGQHQLCAYITADRELAAGELRGTLAARLPGYMIPAHIAQLNRMPLTPNGKIDLRALPAPEYGAAGEAVFAAPRTAAEQALATVWQGVLGVETVGLHDNFFELGGDSIKSIQVASRLRQAGYKLEMKELFAHPTVAELGSYLQPAGKVADQCEVTGEIELTPIQHWFFEQRFAEPHHFNQAVMLQRTGGFDEAVLRQVFSRLVEHHDALRLVFRPDGRGGYTAWSRPAGEDGLFALDVVDLRQHANPGAAVEAGADEAQRRIDLSEGPLVRLALFRCADGDHLLIVIHHLVVDGISWRILFEDVGRAYEQALAGDTIRLPHKTDSFRAWARTLAVYAASAEAEREATYWQRIERADVRPLPKDLEAASTLMIGESGTVTVAWTEAETESLLKQAHRAYNTEVNDLLLAALGIAVGAWSGLEQVLVNLEGHGREAIDPGVDVTRTVGWFTSQFPVLLAAAADQPLGRRITRVKEELRQIPRKGIGYGILRYVSPNTEHRSLCAEPEISFNYLGQFDQDAQSGDIRPSHYEGGSPISARTVMKHTLGINGLVTEGRLSLAINYNAKAYRPETVERLAALLASSLREVIAHCTAKAVSELTPSDVALRGITLDELERLAEQTASVGELENLYRLTPMQQGMLFHSLLDPKSGAYFEQATFELRGNFDPAVFAESLDRLVARHAVLRTNVYSGWRDEALQVVYRNRRSDCRFNDIREMGEAERQAYLRAYAERDKAQGFDLAKDALMRVSILQTGDRTYSFVWSFHHLLMDGWCLSLVSSEVFGTYFALAGGKEPQLAPVTPYARYLEWLEGQNAEEAAAYWRVYLAGYDGQTLLPTETAPYAARPEGEGHELISFELGRKLSGELHQAAKRHRVTINTLLQSAWGVVLQRYNNSDDVVFGSVVSGRPADIAGIETMIGLFINTIPVRVRSEEGETFAQLMKRIQRQALASNAHDTYPLYEIQADTPQKQDLIRHIMIFENYPLNREMEKMGGRDGTAFEIVDTAFEEQTNYDFTMTVLPGDAMTIQFSYNARVLAPGQMRRTQGHLMRLLTQIAADPSVSLSDLELITGEENIQIEQQFNATAADYSTGLTLPGMFAEQAKRNPERLALTFEGGSMTYGQLYERAGRLARVLCACGVGLERPVGVLAERSADVYVAVYAVLLAGGAYVPIDPAYPDERIGYILEDAGAGLLLTQTRLLARAAAIFAGAIVDLNAPQSDAAPGFSGEMPAKPDYPAYIIYTSGSTGLPKGVAIAHRSAVNLLQSLQLRYPLEPSDILLHKTSVSFDASIYELFWALSQGAAVHILEVGREKDPGQMMNDIGRYGITTVQFVPSMLHMFLDYAQAPGAGDKLASLRHVLVGGEALSVPLAERFRSALTETIGTRLTNAYGPTETTVECAFFDLPADYTPEVIPIGRPIHNVRLYIVKAGTLQLQPVGVPGELLVAGAGVGRGYVNRPELTAEKFVDSPFAPGEKLYRTGDLARWLENGQIEYIGRMDRQVKIRGYRIELGEVEAGLQAVEGVQEAAVVAITDDSGQKLLRGYYVAAEPLEASVIREALAVKLPAFMVPSLLIPLEKLPVTASGKIDRNALPAPAEVMPRQEEAEVPVSAAEQQLEQMWKEILELPAVGLSDNFFEIGGHSLRAAALMRRIQKELNVALPLKAIFDHPTIRQLAAQLPSGSAPDVQAIVPAEAKPSYPLSSAQKRVYIASQQVGGEISYNIPSAVAIEGPLDIERLEETLRQLIARHESLRTGFEMVDGEPAQRVYDDAEFRLERVYAGGDGAQERLDHFVRAFDLRQAPLMRAELIALEDAGNRHLLQLDMHHLIADGASMTVFIDEFIRLYNGETLPPLRIHYKDYAVWLAQWAESRQYREHEAYWLHTLSDRSILALPTDYPRTAGHSFDGAHIPFVLEPELTASLQQLAAQAGCTLFMVMAAAYTALLSHYTGQDDIIVGTPVAGRPSTELEPLIGMFVNMVALRSYPGEQKTFASYLQEVKELALNAFEHQLYPMEELADKLSGSVPQGRNPLFDTSIVLQNNERRELQLDGLAFTPLEPPHAQAKLDLSLYLMEEQDGMTGSIEYSTALFKETTMHTLIRDFRTLLSAVTDNPGVRLGDLELRKIEPQQDGPLTFLF